MGSYRCSQERTMDCDRCEANLDNTPRTTYSALFLAGGAVRNQWVQEAEILPESISRKQSKVPGLRGFGLEPLGSVQRGKGHADYDNAQLRLRMPRCSCARVPRRPPVGLEDHSNHGTETSLVSGWPWD